jgi:hypothetical protein
VQKLPDPGVTLAFAQEVTEMGEGTDDITGIAFGSLLFHDQLQHQQASRDICHMPSTVYLANGVVTGGGVTDVSCGMTVVAPTGSSVQIKMMENTLHANALSVYNSTSVAPANLVAVLTGRDTGRIITSGTITVVESEKQQCTRCTGETFKLYWSFIEACADMDNACPDAVDQVSAFGFDCDTQLNDVDTDDIAFPPHDMRSCEGWANTWTCSRSRALDAAAGGEVASECDEKEADGDLEECEGTEIPLPSNPVTGKAFTEVEFRQLAAAYLPQLRRQYGTSTLAEYCPVSCVTRVCPRAERQCRLENRCGTSSCAFTQSPIEAPQFYCDATEMVEHITAGGCTALQPAAGFCSSRCFAALGPWVAHCGDQSDSILNDVYQQSVLNWVSASAALRLIDVQRCETKSTHESGETVMPPAGITVVYNYTSRHGAATYLNIALNAMRTPLTEREAPDAGQIFVNNHPMPFTSHQVNI